MTIARRSIAVIMALVWSFTAIRTTHAFNESTHEFINQFAMASAFINSSLTMHDFLRDSAGLVLGVLTPLSGQSGMLNALGQPPNVFEWTSFGGREEDDP